MPRNLLPNVRIVHLSDLHIGDDHRFQPPVPPDGRRPPNRGYPSLAASVAADLKSSEFAGGVWRSTFGDGAAPVLIALTGDLTHTAGPSEFDEVDRFIQELTESRPLGGALTASEVHVVPGNHDVVFAQPDPGERWLPY